MPTAAIPPLHRHPHCHRHGDSHRTAHLNSSKARPFYLNYTRSPSLIFNVACVPGSRHLKPAKDLPLLASSTTDTAIVEISESSDVVFSETFQLKRPEKVCNLCLMCMAIRNSRTCTCTLVFLCIYVYSIIFLYICVRIFL